MTDFFKIVFTSFVIYFLSWFAVYNLNINTLPIQSEDTVSTIFTTIAIIKDKTLYLDNYYDQMVTRYPHPDDQSYTKNLTPFYLKKVNNNYLTAFPLITSIISVPIFAVPILFNIELNWENIIYITHIASSIIMSVTVYLFYLLLMKRFSLSKSQINMLTILFGFGTINFAMFSQGLWQYATLQLFLILSLYFSFSKNLFLSGFFSGIAVLTRPTALLAVIFNPFINFNNNKIKSLKDYAILFISFIAGFIPNVLFFIWYNNIFYKDLSNQGYAAQAFNSWLSKFPEGFLGIWISPSKGLLIFTPAFIFIFLSFYIVVKKLFQQLKDLKYKNPLITINTILNYDQLKYILFFIIVITHTFIMGFWKHWYGGYSFGYRMAADVIVYLVLLLIPFVSSKYFKKYNKIFISTIIFSVLVQIYGLIFFDSIWHLAYDLGFKDTSWLWSIKDSEWVFNFRRVLVKLGLMYQACPKCLPN